MFGSVVLQVARSIREGSVPIITISRGAFSGGKELAECLASELGYPCISRDVIVEAAATYGASPAELGAALNRAPSFLDRIRKDRDRYLAYIRAVLCQHAQAGPFVYHGHAGHHLLAGIRHVLRVRIVADLRYRVTAAMERLNMTSRQAEAHIRKDDAERRKWSRFLYGVAWEDPSNYDVVLNIEFLGIDGACATVRRMSELEPFQPTPESLRAVENLALASRVTAALAGDALTRDAEFRVRADDGIVSIEGVVRTSGVADAAAAVARSVPGVKDVINQVVSAGFQV
jgi:cytidylate kinase